MFMMGRTDSNFKPVYPPTRHLSSRVRAFVDFLADRLASEPLLGSHGLSDWGT